MLRFLPSGKGLRDVFEFNKALKADNKKAIRVIQPALQENK